MPLSVVALADEVQPWNSEAFALFIATAKPIFLRQCQSVKQGVSRTRCYLGFGTRFRPRTVSAERRRCDRRFVSSVDDLRYSMRVAVVVKPRHVRLDAIVRIEARRLVPRTGVLRKDDEWPARLTNTAHVSKGKAVFGGSVDRPLNRLARLGDLVAAAIGDFRVDGKAVLARSEFNDRQMCRIRRWIELIERDRTVRNRLTVLRD